MLFLLQWDMGNRLIPREGPGVLNSGFAVRGIISVSTKGWQRGLARDGAVDTFSVGSVADLSARVSASCGLVTKGDRPKG